MRMEKKESMRYVYPLCFGEEVGNCITHGVMGILILFSLPYYSVRAYLKGGCIEVIGTSVFLICMFFMFMASCLYHSMPHDTTHKYVFRKLDHIMILLAIAGTYTPICLRLMNNWKGYIILSIEWVLVIGGILLKSIAKKSYPKLSMSIYMIMGWLAIFILPTLIHETSLLFILFIALGGVMYTIGTFFYAKPQKKFFHFIWHIFIILASLCHFIAILYLM